MLVGSRTSGGTISWRLLLLLLAAAEAKKGKREREEKKRKAALVESLSLSPSPSQQALCSLTATCKKVSDVPAPQPDPLQIKLDHQRHVSLTSLWSGSSSIGDPTSNLLATHSRRGGKKKEEEEKKKKKKKKKPPPPPNQGLPCSNAVAYLANNTGSILSLCCCQHPALQKNNSRKCFPTAKINNEIEPYSSILCHCQALPSKSRSGH